MQRESLGDRVGREPSLPSRSRADTFRWLATFSFRSEQPAEPCAVSPSCRRCGWPRRTGVLRGRRGLHRSRAATRRRRHLPERLRPEARGTHGIDHLVELLPELDEHLVESFTEAGCGERRVAVRKYRVCLHLPGTNDSAAHSHIPARNEIYTRAATRPDLTSAYTRVPDPPRATFPPWSLNCFATASIGRMGPRWFSLRRRVGQVQRAVSSLLNPGATPIRGPMGLASTTCSQSTASTARG